MKERRELSGEEAMSRRVAIGCAVSSVLGTFFGTLLIVGGSFMTWRADNVLGLYASTGWSLDNLINGDGKITFALGVLGFIGLVLGAILSSRAMYGLSVACCIVLLVFTIYELVFLSTRTGVVTPGSGIYMILGGLVACVLCSLGGYFLVSENSPDVDDKRQ